MGECEAAGCVELAEGWVLTRLMLPVVRVPVLSITMRLARVRMSSTWPRRSRMPLRVRLAVAEVSAVGVASERAQGQVATSTARVTQKACSG
jgi:hypothetical protein